MIKVVDIVYHCHHEYADPKEVLEKHRPTLGFIEFIQHSIEYTVVRHLNYEGKAMVNNIRYAFFKRRNAPWQIPFKTHRYIKSLQPDIVLVHGFVFPLQVIALKMLLGKNCAVILQHHAERPRNSIRKFFQQLADSYVQAYMFTASAIATPWLMHHIIRNKSKITELSGAAVVMEKKDKHACKLQLGMQGNSNFFWVGRLNENKDPITVLKAFAQYIPFNPGAALYMVYQGNELLEPVKKLIRGDNYLYNNVRLIGKIPPAELATWYNAADYFISGSHAEAAGYALLEAMSVGCIPVVTHIPSYKKLLDNGRMGFMFVPGDAEGLDAVLRSLTNIDPGAYAKQIEDYFNKKLHFKAVANGMYEFFVHLHSEQR